MENRYEFVLARGCSDATSVGGHSGRFNGRNAKRASRAGELAIVKNADGKEGLLVFKMTVDPAKEAVPALRHRLMLRERELKPGNAATLYLRAYPEGGIEQTWKSVRTKFGEEEVDRWSATDTPLAQLPLDKVREATALFDTLVQEHLRPASERLDCDWGHRTITERRGAEVYNFLLPEMQVDASRRPRRLRSARGWRSPTVNTTKRSTCCG